VKFLLDTNVVSETSKKKPDLNVLAWLGRTTLADTGISAMTIGEIRRGIELVPEGSRRVTLEAWYQNNVRTTFAGRTLSLDDRVLECWGERMAALSRQGTSIESLDGLIAATALVHGLTLVTRNTDHFLDFGIPLENPWQ
jgi:toxin FitB